MSENTPLKKGDEAKQAKEGEGEDDQVKEEEEEETCGDKCSKGIIFVVKVSLSIAINDNQ